MSRKLWITVTVSLVTMAIAAALMFMTVGLAATDPVTIKLTQLTDGAVTVVDIAITNNTGSTMNATVNAVLPTGAEFAGANPPNSYKISGNMVSWIGKLSPNKTTGGYQYKFKISKGTAVVSVDYIGSTRGTAASSLEVTGAASSTAGGAFAVATTAATKAPVAELSIAPIPANAAASGAIKASLPGTTTTVAMGTTGLPNVSIGVPVTLEGASTDEKSAPAKTYAWTLTAPSTSKAKLDANNAKLAKFTPDVAGIYKVDLVVSNEAGKSATQSVKVRAGTYIGVVKGGCAGCHTSEAKEWADTNHAKIMTQEIDGGAEPSSSHYGEGCLRCHTTGYYIGAENGGFAQVQQQTGWKFPSLAKIQTGKGNWDTVPADLKNMANIQCEACHGPAKEHVTDKAPMSASLDEGVCNVCHNGGGHHVKGSMFVNAKHGDGEAEAWTYPTGPARQDCVRCHSGKGYISFINNPTEKSTWNNEAAPTTCAVCHEPHSDANKFQLRIVGKPVEANGITKDFGLSATCVECHNGRVQPSAAKNGSFPHYSTAGELLSNTGGVEYGQKVLDSPHGTLVGTAPISDPSDNTGQSKLFGGNAAGACVACHMWPTISDAKNANQYRVGDHSFNMVTPDGTFDYTAACQSCHPGVKTFADFKAREDYDGNGKTEAAQAEVGGLLAALKKAIGDSGIQPVTGHPYFDQSNKANWSDKQKNAIFNYLFVRGLDGSDGKGAAIHNFKRSVTLLQLSYRDLAGKDLPNATKMAQ